MKKQGRILAVDDNAGIRSALKILLPMHFEAVELLPSPVNLISTVETFKPDAVLLDMNFVYQPRAEAKRSLDSGSRVDSGKTCFYDGRTADGRPSEAWSMPSQDKICEANFKTDINTGNEGLYWLRQLKAKFPELRVVLFTAYADIQLAVEGMKRGAFDFLVKPWDNEKLIAVLRSACEYAKPQPNKADKNTAPAEPLMYWGETEAMTAIRHTLDKIAPTDATVLITGENGTGKDVLAKEIHRLSQCAAKPMVSVDAGSIPDTLFESQLFGHVKGAFTDAVSDHKGFFEQADGGTLFLDEIGNISLANQAKLLRVLQSRTVTRVGSTESIPVNIRLICATNVNLAARVKEGGFREDLYYRLNTIHIELPALRSRPQDILPLAEMFLKRYAEKYHRSVTAIDKDSARLLENHPWNGNIRELQNCIEKAVILCEGETLSVPDLSLPHREPRTGTTPAQTLEQTEEQAIRTAMSQYGGNLSLVAKSLNISRPTLYAKLKKYGI